MRDGIETPSTQPHGVSDVGAAISFIEPVHNCGLPLRSTGLHHILVLAITERVMPDTEPANDLDVADILKVARS